MFAITVTWIFGCLTVTTPSRRLPGISLATTRTVVHSSLAVLAGFFADRIDVWELSSCKRKNEIWVGIFLLAALLAAALVCLKAANVTSIRTEPTYTLYATFDNIGGLKARSGQSVLVALLWVGWRILRWTRKPICRA